MKSGKTNTHDTRAADAARHFAVPGMFMKAEHFGLGLINDTYRCDFTESGTVRRYVLQRINASVFKRPDQVMQNVATVTAHILNRLRAGGLHDPSEAALSLVSTRAGQPFFIDESGAYWRMFPFIESGTVFDTVQNTQHAYEVGRCLGRFQALVADLLPDALHDTLPGFHHTPMYLSEYYDAYTTDSAGRSAEASVEHEFVMRRRSLAPILTDLMRSHEVPLRVVHNDPKVNNVMLNSVTREALCMLDLDTVKAGTVLFDFGDCARSTANPAGEDAVDAARVKIDLDLFQALTKGYIREAESFLTNKEREMLPVSVRVITFELGIRFLTDFLRGDVYFKTAYPSHNLYRARVQFRLLESMEAAAEQMSDICGDGARRDY